jgi:hypothetical protein
MLAAVIAGRQMVRAKFAVLYAIGAPVRTKLRTPMSLRFHCKFPAADVLILNQRVQGSSLFNSLLGRCSRVAGRTQLSPAGCRDNKPTLLKRIAPSHVELVS